MAEQKVEYEKVNAPEPMVLVVRRGGETFEIRLALAVGEVVDTGLANPFNDLPTFTVQAHVAVDVRKRETPP